MLAGRTRAFAKPRLLLRALLVGTAAIAVLAPTSAVQAEPSLGEIEKQLETAGGELEDVIESYNKINEELKGTQGAADDLGKRMEPLQTDMNAAYTNVDLIASTAYKSGSGFATWGVLLNAGSSESFIDQLTSLEHMGRVKQRDIAGYAEVKGKYAAEKKRLDELLVTQTTQRADLESRKIKIEADLKNLQDLKQRAQAARPKSTVPTSGNVPPPPAVSGKAGLAVQFAYGQLGKPYEWGADGPGTYDCSGLTMKAWAAAGVPLPHSASMQWNSSRVRHISRSALAPGDLVFYRNLGHVGIYVGNNTIIHAPTTGEKVQTSPVDKPNLYGYARPS